MALRFNSIEELRAYLVPPKKTEEEKRETRKEYYKNLSPEQRESIRERQRKSYERRKETPTEITDKRRETKKLYNATEKAREMQKNWQSANKSKYCDCCRKDVNRKSYAKHTRTLMHINKSNLIVN
jgi:hypothetical protein